MPPKATIIYDIATKVLGHSQAGAFKFNPHENSQDLEAVFEKLRSDGLRFSIYVSPESATAYIEGSAYIGSDPISMFLYAVWARYCQYE